MKGNKRSTCDIISILPNNIIENILMALPLTDAVRTSILSSKWRYKWVTLPQLAFSYQFFSKGWDNEILKAVIYQVLLLHHGSLIKFELFNPPFESCIDINNWIFILSMKNIEEFTFMLLGGLKHEIPSHLYSFLQLRKLKLSYCVLKPPTTFKGFSRLVNLDFLYVNICAQRWEAFISNCPLLEQLRLRHCSAFKSLKINSPNLKVFEFMGDFESLSLKNTTLLAEISVALLSWGKNIDRPEVEKESEWVKFFHSLPAIEDMHLDRSFLEAYATNNVPERLPSTMDHLKVLSLSDVCYSSLEHVSWAFCLLRSSPNLLKLQTCILNTIPVEDPVVEFLQAQDFSEFSLNKLEKVKIRFFSGAEPEMLFVKILLAHSAVLKKMVILYEPEMSSEKGFAMLKELTRFPRASPKAEVIILEAPDD